MRKFNVNQVCNIRHAVNVENTATPSVAKKFKSSPSTIRRVASGDSYSDVPMPRAIPGFSGYLAYPNNKIWSVSRNRFLKPVTKGSSKTKYYNLKAGGQARRAIRADEVSSLIF